MEVVLDGGTSLQFFLAITWSEAQQVSSDENLVGRLCSSPLCATEVGGNIGVCYLDKIANYYNRFKSFHLFAITAQEVTGKNVTN